MSTNARGGLQTADSTDTDAQTVTISGPHLGLDQYGNPDHTYFACESCGEEWDTTFGRDEHDCEGAN